MEDVCDLCLSGSVSQLLRIVDDFARPESLRKLVVDAFPPIGNDINLHLRTLSQLAKILRHLQGRKNDTFSQMLNQLAFSIRVTPRFWQTLETSGFVSRFRMDCEGDTDLLVFFTLLCHRWLLAVDDHEFFDSQVFLSLEEWAKMVLFVKSVVIAQFESRLRQEAQYHDELCQSSSRLLRLLYDRE